MGPSAGNAGGPAAIDWSVLTQSLAAVPAPVWRVAQFLFVLALFGVAYLGVRGWLERRRDVAGWDDQTLQAHCALARALALIVGLLAAAQTTGVLAGPPSSGSFLALVSAILAFVATLVKAALFAAVLLAAAFAASLVLGARETALSCLGGLALHCQRAGREHLPRVGDTVEIGETRGVIEAFSLMKTNLRQDDGTLILVPNAWAVDGRVTVVSPGSASPSGS